MRSSLLLSGGWILPMTEQNGQPTLPFVGWVGIENERIVLATADPQRVAAFRKAHPEVHEIDCHDRVVMPGLINTHCHVAMTLQRSYADDIPLMEWLNEHIWPFEAVQRPDEVALGAELGIAEMLLGGVTSFVDMYWDENRIAPVADRLGIRALLCPSFINGKMEENEADLKALLPLTSQRVRAGIGPHAPYTLSQEQLLRCKELSEQYQLPITIHVAETKAEMETISKQTGMTPTQYLDSLGLLSDRVIAAHCVYVDPSDRQILQTRGVKVAHNPTSNMKIASGIAPVECFAKEGICSTIGTDGPCSNNDLDMWEEMRQTAFLAKVASGNPLVLPAWEVLRMATVEGAKAIGHDGELGIIQEGALADLITLNLRKPHLQPLNNLVANLVYCAKSSDVETVIVDGQVVVENHQIPHLDLETLYQAATQAVKRITAEIRHK